MAARMDKLRDSLKAFKESRDALKALKEGVDKVQPEILAVLSVADPDDVGVIFDPTDKATGTAYYQQNNPSEFWDIENVIQFVKDNKMWMACSSRSFDVQKFEAEIANGNITPRQVQKFRKKGKPPAPFIRFGKAKKESL